MPIDELTFSTFLRNPRDVIDRLEHGEVVLRRRGAQDLRLTLADRADDRDAGDAIIARILASLARDGSGHALLLDAVSDVLTWMDVLPLGVQREFVDELLRAAETAATLRQPALLSQVLREWEETAALYADPAAFERMTRPLPGDGGPVTPPVAMDAA